jgi:ATPase subunit of ABC transporter with duplicated ATPase domains
LAQLDALTGLRNEKVERLASAQSRRGEYLNTLDQVRERRFRERVDVAKHISSQLKPRISVRVLQAAQLSAYAGVVSSALRGSGLKYAELSSIIASHMSPRELVETTERGDAISLASILGIAPERAAKLISHLRDHGPAEILGAPVEDDVVLALLDGSEYKNIANLSTGQRCTVILPMVLEHKDRVLVVDQPEDHLDNEFVVDTLVRAIMNRGGESQLLLSTHNANIPVLGGASQVVVMGSDGQRGFVERRGPLDDELIVRSITTLMEGGADAFERRAKFYRSHHALNE